MAKAPADMTLGEYLVREGLISQSQLNKALDLQRSTSRSVGRILIELQLLTEPQRMSILQKDFGFELIRLNDFKADQMLLTMIPYAFAEKHRVVPVKQENRTLKVAMEDPSDLLLLDALKHQVGMAIQPLIASHDDIQSVLHQYHVGAEAAKAQALAAHRPKPLWYRFLRSFAFPILALVPLVLFFVAIAFNVFNFADLLQKAKSEGSLNTVDMIIYISLIWGLWTIILFEINGLIFGQKKNADQDEAA